jgi:hypothetical protein
MINIISIIALFTPTTYDWFSIALAHSNVFHAWRFVRASWQRKLKHRIPHRFHWSLPAPDGETQIITDQQIYFPPFN